MSQKNNFTKNEHYIPQFYLKNFSPDGKMIYQYKIKSNAPSKVVPIETICYKKNLYELKTENNEFICRNAIEDTLMNYEGEFANIIKSIIAKSKFEDNYKTPCFLSTDEKRFLIIFVATSILRAPRVLDGAKESIQNCAKKDGKKISSNTAYNSALVSCLPFINHIDEDYKSVLGTIIEKLLKMAFIIGVTNNDSFFTSDNPVFWYGNSETFEIEEVIFPLTSRIVLFLYPIEQIPVGLRNIAIHLTDSNVIGVNYRIILFCREWLFCKKEIKDHQVKKIEEIKENQNAVL